MKAKPNNAAVIDMCVQRLNALGSNVKPDEKIGINGEPHTAADVQAIYQTCLDTRAELASIRAQAKTVMAKRASAEAARRAADRALKPWVVAQFGEGSKVALEFGFRPPRKPVRTPEEKLHAKKLAEATRKARHTIGPKARLGIKGALVPETSAPPTTPSSGAAVPEPSG